MVVSFRLLLSPAMAVALIAAAIIVILFSTHLTAIANAQQQPTSQSSVTQDRLSSFQSTKDSYRVQVPSGWVIHDVKNTGVTLLAEVLQGYGILAQLCPQEQQQQIAPDAGGSNTLSSSCQGSQVGEDVIQIIRYPNLGARLGIALNDINGIVPDSVLNYQIQKLQEVGYRDINIVNITDATINIHYTTAQDVPAPGTTPLATVPARFVEITYSTDSAPSEIRSGYLFLTATNATPPNEMITGYSIFYEGRTAARAEDTTQSGSLLPVSPAAARILASFELIASEEVAQSISDAIAQQAAVGNEPNDQVEDAAGEEAEDDDE
jgi:hypothetical protein